MKKFISIALFALFATVSNAAVAKKEANPEIPAVAPVQKADYKDAFLGLVLEKAEKYSSAFESGLGKAVDGAQAIVSKAVDVASEEAPKLMQEFLVWRFIDNVFGFALPFVLFLIFGSIAYNYLPKWIDTFHTDAANTYSNKTTVEDTKQVKYGLAGVIFTIAAIITGAMSLTYISNLKTALQIKVAPRVYIIEQAVEMYKDTKTPTNNRR